MSKNKFPPKKPSTAHLIKANPKRDWSTFQRAIFKDIAKGSDHTVVIARAGSGKTSTIVEGFKYIPRGKKTLMVAFNKSIAEELKQRAPSYVDTYTLHSLGFRAIKQSFGEVTLDNDKCRIIVNDLIGNDRDLWDLNQNICKCVSLCKGFLWDTPARIEELIEKFGIETFDLTKEQFIQHVIKTLSLSKSQKQIIDFDDMIYFPFVYRLNVGKFDVVFVDEAQDLNTAQMAMVLSACKIDGRIIAVGDPAQSIYQFRGADSEAIPNFINKLKAKTLPLSVTYRCPKKIVALAKEIVPDIECPDSAIDGIVENIQSSDLLKMVKPGDFVLSRTNAPLIKHCMALLKANIPANIQGRDVGANLLYFIKKSKAKTVNAFISYVNEWRDQEVKRLLSEKKNTENCLDKAECLLNLCEGTLTIKDLQETIEKLFDDDDNSKRVILSTTHKAKGLERDRVFMLVNTYRYGPGVTGEEANLYYVAVTRSKKELYMVRTPSKYSKFDNKKKKPMIDPNTGEIHNPCSKFLCDGCDECCDSDHHFIDHYYSESAFA
jgi:DNA helicase II / ATP-dependent DNA helicase PcrA